MQAFYFYLIRQAITILAMMLVAFALVGCNRGAPVQHPDLLLLAIMNDSKQDIQAVLQANPSLINAELVTGDLPLYHAILADRLIAIEALLEAGADPSQGTISPDFNTIDSPLKLAVRLCRLDIVKMLLHPDISHFFNEQALREAIDESRWQSGCHSEDSFQISQHIEFFIRAHLDLP